MERGLLAVDLQDEEEVFHVLNSLRELGISLFWREEEKHKVEAEKAVAEITEIGEAAARQGIVLGVLHTAVSLGKLGKEAARAGKVDLLLQVSRALGETGKNAARQKMKVPVRVTASALKEVGKEAARQKMEEAVIANQLLLRDLGRFSGFLEEKCFEELSPCIVSPLREIGKTAAREGLETAATSAEVLLEDTQLRLNMELFKQGNREINERKLYEETCNALHCLGEIGKISAQMQLKKAASQAYQSLNTIRKDAEVRYLGNTYLNANVLLDSLEKTELSPGNQTQRRELIEKLHAKVSAHLGMQL